MKHGFILLEVIIASAISAMLSMMLFNSLTQLNRGTSAAYSAMSLDTRFMLFLKYFTRDISGAMVPLVAKKTEKEETPKTTSKASTTATVTTTTTKPTGQPEEQKKTELEPLKDPFVVTIENNVVREISFISTSALPGFNVSKQRMVRVAYRVENDPEHKNSMRIMRHESPKIEYSKESPKKERSYLLIDGVKAISIEFIAFVEEKQDQSTTTTGQGTAEKPKKKRVVVKEWPSPELEKHKEILLPDYVNVTMTLWNMRFSNETKIQRLIPIAAIDQSIQPAARTPQRPAIPSIPKFTASKLAPPRPKLGAQASKNNTSTLKATHNSVPKQPRRTA